MRPSAEGGLNKGELKGECGLWVLCERGARTCPDIAKLWAPQFRRWMKNQKTHVPPNAHQDLLDKAKDRDTQQPRMELHIRSQTWRALARMAGGSCLTFAFADWLKKFCAFDFASKDHQQGTDVERRPFHLAHCGEGAWPAITPHWKHGGQLRNVQKRQCVCTTSRLV